MDAKIFRINYKSDFILTLNSDAGWMTPFCIKFWTGAPSQAYFVGWDGETYTHCAYDPTEPTKLLVQFDDHHLPIGDLKFQIAYHFTVADFPDDTEDEVINPASITVEIDGEHYQVMLDFTGETAPEIAFSLPAYANEAQRIANEQQRIIAEEQRIANEQTRIAAEATRQQNEEQRIQQESMRVRVFAQLKQESEQATDNANVAALLANEKAQLAADKAALAQSAATLANQKAQLAADKAALADAAAALANQKAQLAADKAALAQQKAEYAQTQGDYAKAQGDYAKQQGEIAEEDHERAEADHTRAESDHATAGSDNTQAGTDHTRAESDHATAAADHTQAGQDHTRAESDHAQATSDHTQAGTDHTRAESDHATASADHTQAGQDHTRAESDHTRAESDHAAVEVYVDSLGAFDISAYHATGGVLAKYADLTAALGTNGANIPEAIRKGGMSVKFVLSSDNKYVQYRLMSTSFSITESNWQGVDETPTAGSQNLVKSGGVEAKLTDLAEAINVGETNSLIFTTINDAKVTSTKIDSITGQKVFYARVKKDVNYSITWSGVSGGTIFYAYTDDVPAVNVTVRDYATASVDNAKIIGGITPNEDCWFVLGLSNDLSTFILQGTYPKSDDIGKDVYNLKNDVSGLQTQVGDLGDDLEDLSEDIAQNTANIAQNTADIAEITNTDEYIITPLTKHAGWIVSGNKIQINSNYYLSYIAVNQGDTLLLEVDGTYANNVQVNYGYTVNEPALNETLYDKDGVSGQCTTEYLRNMLNGLAVPMNGYFVVSTNVNLSFSKKIKNTSIAKRLDVVENELGIGDADLSDKLLPTSTIYDLIPNSGFLATNRIFPEGLINDSTLEDVRIDGQPSRIVGTPLLGVAYDDYNQNIKVTSNGYAPITIPVHIIRSNPSVAVNKSIRLMCIGDSLTQGGYPALVEYIFKRLNTAYSGISATLIGRNKYDDTIEMNGIEMQIRGCHEGKGGCGVSDYLRHLFMVRASGTDVRYGGTISGKTAWDSLGLGTKTKNGAPSQTYVEYTGSDEQKEQLRTTCHGYYDADPSSELWQFIKNIHSITSFTYNGTTYTFADTYSSSEDAKIIACIKWMCESDDFKSRLSFYDYDTVVSSNGLYAFNITKYLSRYKTLADDGTTRLVVGSTAGSMVTNVDAFDVCTPNYIAILMNHNDLNQYANVSGTLDDVMLIARLSHIDTQVKVVVMSNRSYGVNDTVAYQNKGNLRGFGLSGISLRLKDFYLQLRSVIVDNTSNVMDKINGLIVLNTIGINSNFNLSYIAVSQGDTIALLIDGDISGNKSVNIGYTDTMPAKGVSVYDLSGNAGYTTRKASLIHQQTITVARSGYLVVSDNQGYSYSKYDETIPDFINLYQLQSPLGAMYNSVDTLDGQDNGITNINDAATHSILYRYIDRAYQVVCWLISKL